MATHGDTLWTIGHSTRPWEVFVAMLAEAGIEVLADVRRFAGSRRNPQFSAETMAQALPAAGIDYLPMPDLGGRRTARPDTTNTAWRNASFRGYADYMETGAFAAARERLMEIARERRTGVMSDDFKARGWTVLHLLAPGRTDEHPYTSAARIVDGHLDYSAPGDAQAVLF